MKAKRLIAGNWFNNSTSHPLQLVTTDGRTIGQFYNSWDKMYHLAEYEPHRRPPTEYLCGGDGNFSASRCTHERNKCPKCWGQVYGART